MTRAVSKAELQWKRVGDDLVVTLRGEFDASSTGELWNEAVSLVEGESRKKLILDASGVTYCDGAGVGLIVELRTRADRAGHAFEVRGLKDEFRRLLGLFPEESPIVPSEPRKPYSGIQQLGSVTVGILRDLRAQISYAGEFLYYMIRLPFYPRSLRWRDTIRVAERAGVDALPIMILMGFLIGLILAFQSAIPLKQFGAEVFVADLVAIATLRELGPLITAILLAGRTGSAFAAEIGTMKVNEEVDALVTMGLSPARFLVLPRMVAAVFVTPLLAIFTSLFALVGAALVVMSFGYPLITYVNQVTAAASAGDFIGGLVKAFAFGVVVASVGCMRGLQTRRGAVGVGESTTRSVVTGIVLIIVLDGVFAVVFYYLGI